MTQSLRRALLPVAVAALLGGCAIDVATFTIGRYGTVTSRHVRLGCNDAYEVFDRPDAGAFLVVTNPFNEGLAGMCGGSAALPRPERMRRIATIFLEETTDRPRCRITRQDELTSLHTEFGYQCAPRGAPAPALRR